MTVYGRVMVEWARIDGPIGGLHKYESLLLGIMYLDAQVIGAVISTPTTVS